MRKKVNNRGKVLVSILLIFATLLTNGCTLLPEEEETLAPPLIKPKQEQYNLYTVVKKEIVKSVKGTGNFIPVNDKTLSFKLSGMRLQSINVKEGDKVTRGKILATLDGGNIDMQVKQQQFQLKKKHIEINFLKDRYARYSSGKASLSDEDLKVMKKDIKIMQIDIEEANMILSELKKQSENFNLVSPINGVITFIDDLKQGDPIEAYKTVVTVSDPKGVQLFYQSESVKNVKAGMAAVVNYKGKDYKSKVVFSPDNLPSDHSQTEKFKNAVVISVEGLPSDTPMGDNADINITLQSKENAIVVPKNAVKSFMGANSVEIMEGTSKKGLNVELGIESTTEVEILSGLKEGEKVILH